MEFDNYQFDTSAAISDIDDVLNIISVEKQPPIRDIYIFRSITRTCKHCKQIAMCCQVQTWNGPRLLNDMIVCTDCLLSCTEITLHDELSLSIKQMVSWRNKYIRSFFIPRLPYELNRIITEYLFVVPH